MKRRSFLAAIGLAPVAVLVTPGRSHAEKLADERAAHPFMIARVPQHTSPEEREEILRQLESLTPGATYYAAPGYYAIEHLLCREHDVATITGADRGDVVSMALNFDGPVPIDDDFRGLSSQDGLRAAVGWIDGVEIRKGEAGRELWARFTLTPAGQQKLADDRDRFLVPCFTTSHLDRVTGIDRGAKLISAAFTTRPMVTGLPAITFRGVA